MPANRLSVSLILCLMVLFFVQPAMADRLYTLTEDFIDGGSAQLADVNPSNNQLQLDITETPFAFVNIAATSRGTLVRIDAATGDIIGEYLTAPLGRSASPSRTSVDSKGNVWVANQGEAGPSDGMGGSVVQIGIVIGGTRVSWDGNGDPVDNPEGDFLLGPFDYNTCRVRNHDAFELVKTSRGLRDIRPWPAGTDGVGRTGPVVDAEDDCILLFQRLPGAANPQHVSTDAFDDVWVGGYPGFPTIFGNPAIFYQLDGTSAAILASFDARQVPDDSTGATTTGCGGFGGLVDDNGVLWSASQFQNKLLHYDPADGSRGCVAVTSSYGLAESVIESADSSDVFIWNSSKFMPNQVSKIDASSLLTEEVFPTGGPSGLEDRGVAVTPTDNHIWVAKAGRQTANEVIRLDSVMNTLKVIELAYLDPLLPAIIGTGPTGLAVDVNGKVWVANQSSNNAMRIDPALNAVDRTVDLGPGAVPNNYSDMAGAVPIIEAASRGTWTVVHDGGEAEVVWDGIFWNTEPEGSQPEGTLITVEAQAADAENDLDDDANYVAVANGEPLAITGRYIKIRATLTGDDAGTSPVLSDLEVKRKHVVESKICDVNQDSNIDIEDIRAIIADRQQDASGPDDPRDWDKDGTISVLDARGCVLECTNPGCSQ